MKIFGFTLTRTKAAPANLSSVFDRGWLPLVREPFPGAWQRNLEQRQDSTLAFAAVFACVTLIAQDIGKLRIKLVRQDADGIWTETTNPAYSPVLRKPNHYQTRIQFLEQWTVSKEIWGNTYVLKERDQRGIVVGLYVLDAQRVRPLVAPNGEVFYQLGADPLSQVPVERTGTTAVPASEIIHDVYCPLYHPLCGVSPLTACGLAALQGLRVQANSAQFFGNGATPSGILTAPIPITEQQALEMQGIWDRNYAGPQNVGKVAVLGNGLKFERMTMSAVDAQLIEQLKWTAENVCTAFKVPAYMIGVGPPPAYNNVDALSTQYYTQCLQNPIESIELLLDEGLGMAGGAGDGNQVLGTELDLDELLRMDTPTRIKAANESINGGGMTPNESRAKFHGLGRVAGGDAVLAQQQNYSLEALAKRDAKADPFESGSSRATAPPDLPVSPRDLATRAQKAFEMAWV